MNKQDFLSLGTARQLQHINNLEALNVQKTEMIRQLEEENNNNIKELKNYQAVCPYCEFEFILDVDISNKPK